MKTIADRWDKFEELALAMTKDADANPSEKLRFSFYAGFHNAMQACEETVNEAGDNEETGVMLMKRLQSECMEFMSGYAVKRIKEEQIRRQP